MSTLIIVPRSIGPVSIDAFLHEQHQSSSTITDYVIEDGSTGNDHMIMNPKYVTIELVDSGNSIKFNELVQQQELREPFDIITGLSVYVDMGIENIDATRDKDTGNILSCSVTLKQVRRRSTSTTQSTSIIADSAPIGEASDPVINDRNAATVERGDVQPVAVAEEQSQSILAKVLL